MREKAAIERRNWLIAAFEQTQENQLGRCESHTGMKPIWEAIGFLIQAKTAPRFLMNKCKTTAAILPDQAEESSGTAQLHDLLPQ